MDKNASNIDDKNNRLKILFFGSDYPPTGGGISTYTKDWLAALSNEKEVIAKVRIFGNKEPRSIPIGKSISLRTVSSVNFFYVGVKIFVDIISNLSYKTIYSFNLFPVGFWVVFWSKIFCKKSVITFYGADACDIRTSKKVLMLQKWAISHANRAITISESTKEKVVSRYMISPDNIVVIYPVLLNLNTKNNYQKSKEFTILSVCRLVERKGVEYIIKAMSLLNDESIKLLIIGGGSERDRLESISKELNLNDKVRFLGKVPDISEYYKMSHVGILASYSIPERGDYEGLGLVLLEAQSYGLPVIGADSGGIREAFYPDKTGILVPEKNAEAIASAILRMKNDKDMYERMSRETAHFLRERFGVENTIRKCIDMLNNI